MTDWDKELARIDKQMASLSDAELTAPAAAKPAVPAKGGQKPARPSASAPSEAAPTSRAATFGLYARFGLSVALGVGMMFWPYDAKCGAGLGLYLAAVLALIVSGVWSAVW